MNVAELLVGQASQRPHAPAIIERSGRRTREISFEEFDDRSARCAGFLSAAGIGPGDHVLVFVPMSIDLYLALVAVFRIGAVAMFLDPSAGADHFDRCCQMVKPAAMIAVSKAHALRITSRALQKIACKFSVGWPVPGAVRWERAVNSFAKSEILPRAKDDPALVTFTSGSTGLPKAAIRSHGFLAAQHASLFNAIQLVTGEVDLATLPIFSLANLASGVTTVIPEADLRRPGFIDPAPVFRQIEQHQITRSVASPAFFERMLNAPGGRAALANLRKVHTGGAPVFPGLMDRLQRAMPHATVVAVYGSTEAEPIAHIARDEISEADARAMLSGAGLLAGPPVPDIDLRIIADQWGNRVESMTTMQFEQAVLGATRPGEIVVHGDHVLRGYMNGQGDEQTKFRVNDQVWHRTGDLGYLDDRHRLWLLGRAESKIERDQGPLYPFAVECAASHLPQIRRTAIVRHDGQIWLIVETAPSDRSGVEAALRSELAWAGVEHIRFVARVPVDKRHNAKIDYPALRNMLDSR